MRLSEWRAVAPAKSAVEPKVFAVLEPVLESLGAGRDPHCWVAWGDDVTSRWQVLAPTPAGLLLTFVRVNVPGEGPRASAKLVRWARVQIGELAVETQGGHRILSFSVENTILKGVDADADRVASFALALIGAIDGRVTDFEAAFAGSARPAGRGRAPARRGTAASSTARAGAKAGAAGSARSSAGKAGSRDATSAGSSGKAAASGAPSGGAAGKRPSAGGGSSRARARGTRSG
jgi:hypothetical protein